MRIGLDCKALIKSFGDCECGQAHDCPIDDIRIEHGAVKRVGDILAENGFPERLVVVGDKTTLEVSDGLFSSLGGFKVKTEVYDSLRIATMDDVRRVESIVAGGECGVLAVGTGSIHDTCRLACAELNAPLCLFATATSMDGFASYSAPIVDRNFKITYPAKCPEVIIADTAILASAPNELKSAGFGDMASKYIALIDWQVAHLITGESYCKRVAELTRLAVDSVMTMSDKILTDDEEACKRMMEGLLLSGIAMSFTKTSRPGSGTEHIMAHFIECKELLDGKIPDYHGEDVGVTTLTMLKLYKSLLDIPSVTVHTENNDWAKIKSAYGELADSMMEFNTPDTVTDGIDPNRCISDFDEIKRIIATVPTYDEVREKMLRAGCKLDYTDIGKSAELYSTAFEYHPYMRRRLSLKRLLNLTGLSDRLSALAGLR